MTKTLAFLLLLVVALSGANATPAPSQPTTPAPPLGDTFDMVVRCSAFNAEIVGFFAKCTGFPPRDFSVIDKDSSGCEVTGDGTKTMQLVVATNSAAGKVRHLPRSVVTSFGIREMPGLAEKKAVKEDTSTAARLRNAIKNIRSNSNLNLEAIIGGSVGGAVFLALLIGGACWHRRRSKQQHSGQPPTTGLHTDDCDECFDDPFLVVVESSSATSNNSVESPPKINPLYDNFL